MNNQHDPEAIKPPARSPWWMVLIQISPLILQLVGEVFLRSQLIPVAVSVGDKVVPLLVVATPGSPDVQEGMFSPLGQ